VAIIRKAGKNLHGGNAGGIDSKRVIRQKVYGASWGGVEMK